MKEYKYKINGIKFAVSVGDITDNKVTVQVNGTPYTVELDQVPGAKAIVSMPKKAPSAAPRTEEGTKVIAKPVTPAGPSTAIKSPLPGTIMSFKVKEGDTIKAGQTVCVLEAMKMENDVHSDKGGVVKKILVNVGDAILEGADIMIIE